MPRIVVQTEAATETSPGAIAEGHYNLVDGKVVVTDLRTKKIPLFQPLMTACLCELGKPETGQ